MSVDNEFDLLVEASEILARLDDKSETYFDDIHRINEILNTGFMESELFQDPQHDDNAPVDELSDDPNSPNYRFKDTGYIADSRKEKAADVIRIAKKSGQRLRATDIDWPVIEQNPRQAKELITKANLFGVTDWQLLQDSGMDAAAGFLIDKIYASIGKEPASEVSKDMVSGSFSSDKLEQAGLMDNAFKTLTRKDYAVGLETIRDRLENKLTVDEIISVVNEIRDELNGVILSSEQAKIVGELYIEFDRLNTIAKAAQNILDEKYQAQYQVRNELSSLEYQQRKRADKGWKPDIELDNKVLALRKKHDELYKIYSDYKDEHKELESKNRDHGGGRRSYENDLEWDARLVYDEIKAIEKQAKAYNLMNNPVTRAWLTFGERFWKLINYRAFRGSDSFAGHLTNAQTGKIKDWSWAEKERQQKVKEATKQEINFHLKVSTTFERIGGKPINVDSTKALEEMIGFRAIQSGNWVLKDPNSAKFHVENTAAAMSDMSDILGINTDMLGFGGRLGMAFGARGVGGKDAASAHYEPVLRVINITKMKGGGSLGHEWFHALDNVIKEMISQDANSEKKDFATGNPELLPQGAIQEAFKNLRTAMLVGDIPSMEVHSYTSKDISNAKYNMERQTTRELPNIIKNAGNAQDAVNAVNAYFGTKRFREKDLKDWRKMAVAYYHTGEIVPDKKISVQLQTGVKVSSFALESSKLDGGVKNKYWSQDHEISARAFQSYLEDKLASIDRKNDYLSVYADNQYHYDPVLQIQWNPYPEKDERKKINEAFDKLFEAIRVEKLFEKSMENKALMDSIFNQSHSE